MIDHASSASPRFFGGRLLLAMPGIGDDNFDHATIAICSHDEHGALGLDIGRSISGLGLRELLGTFEIDGSAVPDVAILRGGPVEPQRGFVLHSNDWAGQEALQIDDEWCLSGSLDVLRAIAEMRGPSRYMVALGYVGWGAGQLEQEMTRHGWFLGGRFSGEAFAVSPEKRWAAGFAACGVDARLLSGRSGLA
jgi:putative transcriptional regulator